MQTVESDISAYGSYDDEDMRDIIVDYAERFIQCIVWIDYAGYMVLNALCNEYGFATVENTLKELKHAHEVKLAREKTLQKESGNIEE